MRGSRRLVPFVLAVTAVAAAQVPVSKEPRHRVVFENAALRILDVNVPPGETTLEHRHDFDLVTISMTNGADTRAQDPGRDWGPVRPRRVLGNASVAEYSGKSSSHRIENVGSSAYQLFAVENLRASGWSAAAAVSALATTVATESRAFRVYDVVLTRTASQTSHTHALPTIAVLITGKALSEGPDAQAKANAPAPVGLKQLDQPGHWVLVPAGDSHHLVSLGSGDARIAEIELR